MQDRYYFSQCSYTNVVTERGDFMTSEELKKENYKKIIDTSKKLFVEKGTKATTLIEIAREAGVAKKTVSNIFGTKNNLLFLVMDSLYMDFFVSLDKMIKNEVYQQATGLEQVMQLLVTRAKYYEKHMNCTKMIFEVEGLVIKNDLEELSCRQYLKTVEKIAGYYNEPIKKGHLDGSIKMEMDEKAINDLLFFSFGAIAQRLSNIDTNEIMVTQVNTWEIMRSVLKMVREYLEKQ